MKFIAILIIAAVIAISCQPSNEEVYRIIQRNKLIKDSTELVNIKEYWGENYKSRIDSFEKTYDVIKIQSFPKCKNYHVLLNFKNHKIENLDKFTRNFIFQNCRDMNVMIYMYSDIKIAGMTTKYPLSSKEYKKLAKFTIAVYNWELDAIELDPYEDAFN